MEKLDGKTFDVINDNIEKLKEIFPEVVTEGKINFEKLQQTLGENVERSKERYDFTWHGKSEAIQLAQKQTTGTLRPCKEESVNWDTTKNLYIEGDNLEVLRTLQSSYRNKIKFIYIDPPYNTGNDFIYKDDFQDNVKSYKEKLNENYKSNADTSGRFHTDWLNMMYPRLKIAKNLLSEDGIICISIDDNELTNLIRIMNEIFGEHNFIANFTWVKKKKGSHLSKLVRSMTEYVVMFSKNYNIVELFGESAYSDKWQPLAKRTNTHKVLEFPRNKVITKLEDGFYKKGRYGKGTSSLDFIESFEVNEGIVTSSVKVKGPFVWTQEKLDSELELGTLVSLSTQFGFNVFRANQADKVKRPPTILDSKLNIGTNEDAYNEILTLFGAEGMMSYPKPVSLIKYLINTIGHYDKNMTVLDFFSGSATTAQATMELNLEDEGNRNYIMVQIPEGIDERHANEFSNISEIGKERIRRVRKKILKENKDKEEIRNLDLGFKVFKLDETNLHTWDYADVDIEQNLLNLVDPLKEGRTDEDVVYEILLKYGVDLTVPIDQKEIANNKIYDVGMGYLIICLEKKLELNVIEEIAKKKPTRVVFYDEGFNDDTVRTNAQQILKRYGVEDIRVI